MTTPNTLSLRRRVTATGHARRGRGPAARGRTWRRCATGGCPSSGAARRGASLYAGPLFADAVARELGVGLLEAPEDWLARLPYELTLRNVEFTTIRGGAPAAARRRS
ncbi:ATP-grasp domain-containing protein OS=Streptomyces aurantiogriseus OX=66870 GN=GCM10010251_50370 PE=4 SV=1 [Streptomyces aurantiogriseus]